MRPPMFDAPPLLRSGSETAATPLHHHIGVHRRDFLKGALAAGAVVGSGPLRAVPALASDAGEPTPIPGGTEIPGLGLFHFFLPGPGVDPSSITDWRGRVGLAVVRGQWEGRDIDSGEPIPSADPAFWEADIRFMDGLYQDRDGNRDRAAFAFV